MIKLDLQYAEQAEEPPSRENFQKWVNLAYIEKQSVPAQVSIRIVSEAESQSLNTEYRNKNKPTNVLSFPMELPEQLIHELDIVMLGDLVICGSVVESEAVQQGKSSLSHWAHMVIHGMLHLQGYDHVSESDAEQMEDLEVKLLKKIGVNNPYLEII